MGNFCCRPIDPQDSAPRDQTIPLGKFSPSSGKKLMGFQTSTGKLPTRESSQDMDQEPSTELDQLLSFSNDFRYVRPINRVRILPYKLNTKQASISRRRLSSEITFQKIFERNPSQGYDIILGNSPASKSFKYRPIQE